MSGLTRRAALRGATAALAWAAHPRAARAHAPFGPVTPPLPAPSLWLSGDDARQFELRQHLQGRITAVQLMFTLCTATCPIQGALFSAVARRLRGPGVQLLSVSIDPKDDTPVALRAWLTRFGAPAFWRAAAPRPEDVDRVLDFCRGRAAGPDRHTGQVYVFDRQARLVFRTADLPAATNVVEILGQVARRG